MILERYYSKIHTYEMKGEINLRLNRIQVGCKIELQLTDFEARAHHQIYAEGIFKGKLSYFCVFSSNGN